MSVPYRTFALLGLAVGMLGVGYAFAPQPGAMTLPTAPAAKATPAAPASKPPSTLVASRPPVPLVTRAHSNYFAPKTEATTPTGATGQGLVLAGGTTTEVATAAMVIGAGTDGGVPPSNVSPDAAITMSANGAQAKAAIELDGYKNVRALEKGPDGVWRGRAMRGGTEIVIKVDATGNVSAE